MSRFPKALLVILPFAMYAQGPSRVSVAGTVLDPNAAVVPGAEVTLTNVTAGAVQSIMTDQRGKFRFESVSAASYQIRIVREGFKPEVLRVRAGTVPVLSLVVSLNLAEVRQEFTVEAEAEQVTPETAANRDTVTLNRSALDDLPVFDQDAVAAMTAFLDPSSVGTQGPALVVDGLEASRVGVSASAIQELRINQDTYSAQFPRPGKGRIEIITKPASPDYHGAFNFLFRDYRLNARDPFALARPTEQRRIYEGSLTGPLGKGQKTSFLITANREEEDAQATVFAIGPTGEIQQTAPIPQRNTELGGAISRVLGRDQLISIRGIYTDRVIQNYGVGGLMIPEAGSNFENREDVIYFNYRGSFAKRLYNQFGLLAGRQHVSTTSIEAGPKIVVLGAFTGGGAQADQLQTENHVAFNDVLTWSSGRHTIRTGVNVPDISRQGLDDNTNTAGTYTFATLQDYALARPLSLLKQSGDGRVVFVYKELGGFFQDEIRVLPNLHIAAGIRYDWQNFVHDNDNFAPRLSVAYAPGKSQHTIFRAGAGIFYDRSGPTAISDLLRYDGVRVRQYLITNPVFPDLLGAVGATNVTKLDPSVRIPYLLQFGAGIERRVSQSATLTVNYLRNRGVHLFRSRDVNAPLPPLYSGRPNPALGVFRQIESAGDLEGQSLEVGLRGKITRYFTGMLQYTLGSAYNNVGGGGTGPGRIVGINTFPANNYDLSGEWARADFDQRHRFVLLGTVNPVKYFKIGAALTAYSGMPYTETTGRDDNHDGLALDRPAGVGRNSLQGPGYVSLDLRWSHDFFISRKKEKGPTATLGFDAFNVLNKVNYVNYIGDLSSPLFGRPVAAQTARRLQVSFRFKF